MKKLSGFLAMLLVLGQVFGAAPAMAGEATLQQLIDAVPEGGELTLEDRIYSGNIDIVKPITLVGSGRTVIEGDGRGNVVSITAPGVRLEKLDIQHSSMDRNASEEYSAVKVTSSGNTLKDLRISDAFHGIYLKKANDNVIENVTVSGVGGGEIAGQGNGIQLIHSSGNRLSGNLIEGSRDGIYFYYADGNTVEGNNISDTRYGLHYMYSNSNRFIGNKFIRNTGGAAIMLSKDIELRGNEISFHQGSQAFGILLQECERISMEDNRFYQNQRGLVIDNSSRNRIAGNRFFHNSVGVEIWSSAGSQVFTGNTFIQNIAPVLTIGGKNASQWNENGIGNLWEDEPLPDLNRDGIGDQPVKLSSSLYKLVKENDLVYLFLQSPAIGVYEKINQLLQRQEVMLEDSYPLAAQGASFPWTWSLVLALLSGLAVIWMSRIGRGRSQ